jgi:hypothetical protein
MDFRWHRIKPSETGVRNDKWLVYFDIQDISGLFYRATEERYPFTNTLGDTPNQWGLA